MSTNPVDPAVQRYLDVQAARVKAAADHEAQRAKETEENKIIAINVEKEYEAILGHLDEFVVQLKLVDPRPQNQVHLDRSKYHATFKVNFYLCTVRIKFFGPEGTGTIPGIELLLPGDRSLTFLGFFSGNTFVWKFKSRNGGGLARKSSDNYSSKEVADLVMQYASDQ